MFVAGVLLGFVLAVLFILGVVALLGWLDREMEAEEANHERVEAAHLDAQRANLRMMGN